MLEARQIDLTCQNMKSICPSIVIVAFRCLAMPQPVGQPIAAIAPTPAVCVCVSPRVSC